MPLRFVVQGNSRIPQITRAVAISYDTVQVYRAHDSIVVRVVRGGEHVVLRKQAISCK